jgi:hypothetical protein
MLEESEVDLEYGEAQLATQGAEVSLIQLAMVLGVLAAHCKIVLAWGIPKEEV